MPAPPSINPLLEASRLSFGRPFDNGFSQSGYLYTAAGLHPYDHDEKIPLFVSPSYQSRRNPVRSVIYNDGRKEEINENQLEALLNKLAAAHQEARENP